MPAVRMFTAHYVLVESTPSSQRGTSGSFTSSQNNVGPLLCFPSWSLAIAYSRRHPCRKTKDC